MLTISIINSSINKNADIEHILNVDYYNLEDNKVVLFYLVFVELIYYYLFRG